MFFPIDLYSEVYINWPKKTKDVQIDFASGKISICGTKPRILWSNKYTPLDDFILIDKGFAEWTSKPTFKERLEVSFYQATKKTNWHYFI
jgi:hypothetical protein